VSVFGVEEGLHRATLRWTLCMDGVVKGMATAASTRDGSRVREAGMLLGPAQNKSRRHRCPRKRLRLKSLSDAFVPLLWRLLRAAVALVVASEGYGVDAWLSD